MAVIVDFHAHVFSDPLKKIEMVSHERMSHLRKQARHWLKPFSNSIHGVQTLYRHLPEFARKNIDGFGGLVPLPGLLIESTPDDLLEAMDDAKVDFALVIAQPPFIPNELVLELGQENPRLIPVVNIPKGSVKPGNILKEMVNQGAKLLKIHASVDGEGPNSARYRALLRTAADLELPVIIHTGCMHSRLLYKNPGQGNAENFLKWYETYPQVKFILAHMNFHEPNIALDLCEEFPNLLVDTSWQPMEVIAEAVRRIGAERVFFGTDWPFIGNNMRVGRQRIEDALETGLLNDEQAELILGENAVKLLGLSIHAG